MNEKERLQLEEELLMTCSKAQAINKYIDELEESSKLSELWCKSQQENARLKDKIDESIEYIRDCCDMDSKWVNLHYDYAQKEMSSNEVDRLLEILKEN